MSRWTISVATYNILADAYIKPEHFGDRDPEALSPAIRHPRLDARVADFGTDAICLQEVDHPTFIRLGTVLRPQGYHGRWTHRGGGKVDGCAIFVRSPWKLRATMAFDLDDGPRKPSNRIAVVGVLALGPHLYAVADVHFEWHRPDVPEEERHGLHQARQMAMHLTGQRHAIVAGDFNAAPGTDVLASFEAHGFTDAHDPSATTYVDRGKSVKMDYLLHGPDLVALPTPAGPLPDGTIIPSSTEPSDHMPLIASFSPA